MFGECRRGVSSSTRFFTRLLHPRTKPCTVFPQKESKKEKKAEALIPNRRALLTVLPRGDRRRGTKRPRTLGVVRLDDHVVVGVWVEAAHRHTPRAFALRPGTSAFRALHRREVVLGAAGGAARETREFRYVTGYKLRLGRWVRVLITPLGRDMVWSWAFSPFYS